MPKTFYLKTLSVGCPKNLIESSTYRDILLAEGYVEKEQHEGADIVVFNTCGCLNLLQQRAKSSAYSVDINSHDKVIIAGCYPLIDESNTLLKDGYALVGPGDFQEFSKNIGAKEGQKSESLQINTTDFYEQPSFVSRPARLSKKIAFFLKRDSFRYNFVKSIMMNSEFFYLTVGSGCSGHCTFCGIKKAIGGPKSKALQEIISIFKNAQNTNVSKDVWLVSDDLGSWGLDLERNAFELLSELLNVADSEHRFVLNYVEPDMFLKLGREFEELFVDKRIMQLCLPTQTGSQAVLRRMGRHYDLYEVQLLVKRLKKMNSRLVIKSQVIVGFPGESWKDFFYTLIYIRQFDGVGVNSYAKIKGTAATKLKDLSPLTIKTRALMAKSLALLIQLRNLIYG